MVIDPVDPAFGFVAVAYPISAGGGHTPLQRIAVSPQGRVAAVAVQDYVAGCFTVSLAVWDADSAVPVREVFVAENMAMGIPSCVVPVGLGLAVASDGSYFITAATNDPATLAPSLRLYKVKPDGQADRAFGSSGSVPLPGVRLIARPTIQVLPNGGIALGGTLTLVDKQSAAYAALGVVMLDAQGNVDSGYGLQGVAFAVPANRPIHQAEGGGMVIAADGSAYVAGSIFEDDGGARLYLDATVARFEPHGQLDRSWGDDGFAIPLRDASTYAQSLAVVNGETYLGGIQNRDVPLAFVVRLTANGRLDFTYGDAGVVGNDDFADSAWHPQVAVDATRRAYMTLMDAHGRVRITRIAADGRPDPSFGLGGTAYVVHGSWDMGAAAAHLILGIDGRPYLGMDGTSRSDSQHGALGIARIGETGGYRAGISAGTAVVYHHQQLAHFFLTANPLEQAKLDAGTIAGWTRTGDRFRVVTAADPIAELSPVCRFYGRPEAGLDSHFFSAAADECAAVLQRFSASWLLESSSVFQVHLADRQSGACPRGSQRILRAFNQRADANHFYGTAASAPAGWTYEGYGGGAYPTAFCAPLL